MCIIRWRRRRSRVIARRSDSVRTSVLSSGRHSRPKMLECCGSAEATPPGYPMTSTGHSMQQRQEADRHNAFVLSNPPLAALHNMTERKLPPPSSASSSPSSTSYMCPYSQAQKAQFAYAGLPSTPHGINDILSRPLATFGQLGVSPLYLNTSAACYAAAAAAASTPLAELPGRPPVYWPGMLQPPAWRTSQGKNNHVFNMLLYNFNSVYKSFFHF